MSGTRARGPRLALGIVRAVAVLVPPAARAAWRHEWEAELQARWNELAARSALTTGARWDLCARALGSALDAMTLGKGGWGMDGFAQDVRLATRSLARRPGFTAVVVLTLAAGIGANTAMFGIARDVLLRPFPYPDADRVMALHDARADGGVGGNVTYPNLADLADAATSFDGIAATRWWVPALEDASGSIVLRGATVTGAFFDVLGVEAGEGRFFRPDEHGPGRPAQVVISHSLWESRFGADPGIVGRSLRLSGEEHVVIGVTGADFEDPWLMEGPGSEPQIWRSVASPPSEWPRSGRSWMGIARVRAGVALDAAQDELDAAFAGLVEAYPEDNTGYRATLTPLRDRIAGPAEPVLYTLLGAVGLLLLIACVNLASLLLGRALERQGELAVHRALGASTWRTIRRGFTEVGLLAAMGGGLGVVLAVWLGRLARGLGPMLPRPVTGSIDLQVAAFAVAVTAMAALLFGTVPALHTARSGDALPGRDSARGRTLGRSGQRLRRGLVVGELALTTALLVGAGLLVRSFQRLDGVELGVRTAGVIGVELHGAAWGDLSPEAAQAQWDAVLEAVRAAPGVESVGAIDYLPLGGSYSCDGIQRVDQPPPAAGEGRCAEVRVVLPGALETLELALVRGRHIAESDGPDAPLVAVIDARMAEEFWPGEDPIGARFQVHTREHEVVGIVADMQHFGPGGATRPMVYLHAPQEGWNGIARGLALVARGGDAGALVSPIRRAVADVNASIAFGEFQPMDGLLDRTLAAPRFRTQLMVGFGLVALLLAVLGVAGVMSFSVTRRTPELGLRLALGARPAELRSLVLGEGVRLVAAGIAFGLAAALAMAGVVDRLLFEVGARDPSVYTVVALVLSACALAACWLPARRASALDPTVALNAE